MADRFHETRREDCPALPADAILVGTVDGEMLCVTGFAGIRETFQEDRILIPDADAAVHLAMRLLQGVEALRANQ